MGEREGMKLSKMDDAIKGLLAGLAIFAAVLGIVWICLGWLGVIWAIVIVALFGVTR